MKKIGNILYHFLKPSNKPSVVASRPESLTQDFRVADDRTNLSQGLLASLLHLHVGVSQHLRQLGNDTR